MNKLMKKTKNNKGFTLIELIVVVAILGILAAIAIPRFAGVQANAQAAANKSTAAAVLSAADIYWTEKQTEPTIALLVSTDYIKADPGVGYALSGSDGSYKVTYTVPANADAAKYTGTVE